MDTEKPEQNRESSFNLYGLEDCLLHLKGLGRVVSALDGADGNLLGHDNFALSFLGDTAYDLAHQAEEAYQEILNEHGAKVRALQAELEAERKGGERRHED